MTKKEEEKHSRNELYDNIFETRSLKNDFDS